VQAAGVGESFKLPNLTALEGCLKGAAYVCSRRLAMKCHGGTFELPFPHRRRSSKVVSGRRRACPRSSHSLRHDKRIHTVHLVQECGGSSWSRWMSRVVRLCSHGHVASSQSMFIAFVTLCLSVP
jgi:hypothetical protein